MKHFKTFLCLVSCFLSLITQAQREFIVKVNPSTGVHTRIDSIPGVNYIAQNGSTFDKNHHRFIFLGIDFGNQRHLYSVNAVSGVLLSSPAYTSNIAEIHYDNSSDKLYGLQIDNIAGKMFVVNININTAGTSIVDTLPFTGVGIGTTFLMEASHCFAIQNGSSLYKMNTITGSMSSVPTSSTFGSVCYDNVNGYAYGIVSANPVKVIKLDPSTGLHSVVGTYTFSGTTSAHKAFDENTRHYTLSSSNHLYSIDVNTGSVVLGPSFPVGLNGGENVIELNYDNSSSILYALHWGNVTTTGISNLAATPANDFSMLPNPASKFVEIQFSKEVGELNVRILNALGQVVFNDKVYQTDVLSLKLERFTKGIYFVTVSDEKKIWGTKKLVVE